MWILTSIAAAADPTLPEPVLAGPSVPPSELELRIAREDHFAMVDRRAGRRAEVMLIVAGGGVAVATAGLGLRGAAGLGDDWADPTSIALITTGVITTTAATPIFMTALARQHHSLTERGVHAGWGGFVTTWVVLGVGATVSPIFAEAPVLYPVWATGSLALGCAQAVRDDRARRSAGLPSVGVPIRFGLAPRLDGMSVVGTF